MSVVTYMSMIMGVLHLIITVVSITRRDPDWFVVGYAAVTTHIYFVAFLSSAAK